MCRTGNRNRNEPPRVVQIAGTLAMLTQSGLLRDKRELSPCRLRQAIDIVPITV